MASEKLTITLTDCSHTCWLKVVKRSLVSFFDSIKSIFDNWVLIMTSKKIIWKFWIFFLSTIFMNWHLNTQLYWLAQGTFLKRFVKEVCFFWFNKKYYVFLTFDYDVKKVNEKVEDLVFFNNLYELTFENVP